MTTKVNELSEVNNSSGGGEQVYLVASDTENETALLLSGFWSSSASQGNPSTTNVSSSCVVRASGYITIKAKLKTGDDRYAYGYLYIIVNGTQVCQLGAVTGTSLTECTATIPVEKGNVIGFQLYCTYSYSSGIGSVCLDSINAYYDTTTIKPTDLLAVVQ